MHEFDIIQRYFTSKQKKQNNVIQDIGDDAAIVNISHDTQICISSDTFIEGHHFPQGTHPYDIGYKALAINLSDLAAMGAIPLYFTQVLSLPENDQEWLNHFASGLFDVANEYGIRLVGGDLSSGPLSVTCTLIGEIQNNKTLLRSNAKMHDAIYVSGTLGDGGLGLKEFQAGVKFEHASLAVRKLLRPIPRVSLAQELLKLGINTAIDISDGLLGDLQHILTHSNVPGAIIKLDLLPISDYLKNTVSEQQAWEYALTAGDDYELCFTASKDLNDQLEKLNCTHIGSVDNKEGIKCLSNKDGLYQVKGKSFRHF